jgi:hypothetical protein
MSGAVGNIQDQVGKFNSAVLSTIGETGDAVTPKPANNSTILPSMSLAPLLGLVSAEERDTAKGVGVELSLAPALVLRQIASW